jgi:hypothetical protein
MHFPSLEGARMKHQESHHVHNKTYSDAYDRINLENRPHLLCPNRCHSTLRGMHFVIAAWLFLKARKTLRNALQ